MDTAVLQKYLNTTTKSAVILILTLVVLSLTAYCLQNGIQTVFTHIYYVPIILAAFWFQKKGVLFSAVLAFIYFTNVFLFTGYNPQYLVAAAGRVVVFIIIAAVTAVLSMRISTQQDDIARSEKKFRAIWEHVPAGIFVVDEKSHEIIAVNPEGERLTGNTAKEMIGHSCHKYICPAEKGKCPISDLHMTIDHSERVLLTKSGEALPVLKTVTAANISGRSVLIENYVPLTPPMGSEKMDRQ